MKVLVTGAGGFIGTKVVEVLRARGRIGESSITALALADQSLAWVPAGALALEGDLGSASALARVAEFAPDVTIHLAAVPGGAAEKDYALGRRVNLDTSLALFEALAVRRERPPIVVYASSVAVYGATLPEVVRPDTPLGPPLTYGAHKLACEILLADFSRRGLLDGRSVRLPGVVARPREPNGFASAFMSDILHALAAGERYTCPVSPQATTWLMSAWRCAENLVHAASMEVGADPARAWTLPVLRLSMGQIVDTLAGLYGADRRALADYAPQPALEAVFANYPLLDNSAARALGLADDGSPEALVLRALATRYPPPLRRRSQ
ncbi:MULTISPECIES: NAD-dependent epimerase/dehydratase family protein [Ramlibacter]|uniref:NAD-dependent epimerase/dehydratase family protein n=1 Tax=Ramlibacter pinisoli TaxID=2682844 RepID=A0A6N8ILW0_9BURK|nr:MULTISPECIES: NAD-dependent epimerase/dehydratase family protein [Ramlibacter]MBA2960482.1 NAD-dependent epimerase/dehydratase family protein [Ramlibacter sp. CGMCC 1.13660]MVQ27814.1 NAD-dependent epimerase/dehydratase family protein [Ramlibacter pinisoli]